MSARDESCASEMLYAGKFQRVRSALVIKSIKQSDLEWQCTSALCECDLNIFSCGGRRSLRDFNWLAQTNK
jgi:hypothetical protein